MRATLRAFSYNGDQSHLFLETAGGFTISVRVQNRDRGHDPFARRGEELWLSWRAEDIQPLAD